MFLNVFYFNTLYVQCANMFQQDCEKDVLNKSISFFQALVVSMGFDMYTCGLPLGLTLRFVDAALSLRKV